MTTTSYSRFITNKIEPVFVACIILLAITQCQPDLNQSENEDIPYVVLVSFDGFRHDYVDSLDLPHFKTFIESGSQAERLIPSYPSYTFPNHYSIVTGMYPGNHGLVDNRFFDSVRNEVYSLGDREKVSDPYYYGGMPIWQLARNYGVKSASFFWVGSEVTDSLKRPDYYFEYDGSIDNIDRVNQVIKWLQLPEAARPHIITLYFNIPDHESHRYGPWGEETIAAIQETDELLGELMTRLDTISLQVNVIVTSDHGMRAVSDHEDAYIFMDEILNLEDPSLNLVNGGTQTHIYVDDQFRADSIYQLLQKEPKYFKVYKKEEFPPAWHYNNYRIGDILVLADSDHYITTVPRIDFNTGDDPLKKLGKHGYDPYEVMDMHGIFYAKGPNIRAGHRIEAFQNIHIYPLIAKILNLELPEIDGDPAVLNGIYVEN